MSALAVPPATPDFGALFRATPTPYLVLTAELEIAAVNDAYLAATARTRDELLGRNIFDAFPDNPDDPNATGVRNLRQSLGRVLRDREADIMAIQRYDIQTASGFEERHWSPVNTPVFGPDGAVAHIIHRVEDVTAIVRVRQEQAESVVAAQALEIRVANQRLHESRQQASQERQRLDAVLEAVPVSVFVSDAQGTLLRVNAASRRLWGMIPARAGQPVVFGQWKGWWADSSQRHGQALAEADWPMARALRGEHVRGDILEVQTFDEPPQRRVALASAAPVRDAQGNLTGAVVVSMDISERVSAEQVLRDADRRKDDFLAMLAHELRNPLAPIRSAADLLSLGRLEGERLRQTSAVIVRQVRHMTGMIDDLLDVSRVTRGLVRLESVRLDAKRIVTDAVEQVRPLIEARGHRLAVKSTPRPAFVVGDHKRLVQVVANILNNAAKYTPDGGHIEVELDAGPDEVCFAVRDNGIGMSEALLARAFELFAQAERSSDRAQGGLGIGLALVKRLVELHGGSVDAQSEGPGRGSRILVRLPRASDAGAQEEVPEAATLSTPGQRALSVLVVDDNRDAAETLALLVEAMGHRALVEYGSAAALERVRREQVDVCLLDIGLPEIDGYGLARQLRQDERLQSALLVAVTGYGDEQDRGDALAAGFDEHLVKPADLGALAALLHEVATDGRNGPAS